MAADEPSLLDLTQGIIEQDRASRGLADAPMPKLASDAPKPPKVKMPKAPKPPKVTAGNLPRLGGSDYRKVTNKLKVKKQNREDESRFRGGLARVVAGLSAMKSSTGASSKLLVYTVAPLAAKLASDGEPWLVKHAAEVAGERYSLWLDREANPILVYRDLTRLYGQKWLDWEPDTLWSELARDAGGDVPRFTRDRIMALRVAVKTDLPWQAWEVFENVARAFLGEEPRFDLMQPLEPPEIALALDWLVHLHPGLDLGEEVQSYIAAAMLHDGFSYAPEVLFGPVQDDLDRLRKGTARVRNAVEKAWKAGEGADEDRMEDDPVHRQLAILRATQELLKERAGELDLTPPLPEMDYDASAAASTPGPVPLPPGGDARRVLGLEGGAGGGA